MNEEFTFMPSVQYKLSLRHFKESDIDTLDEGHRHLRLIKKNIPQCYIVETGENIPCYRQWLIGFEENQKLVDYFGDLFPKLNPGEALVEGIFTKPEFRGNGIMPNALDLINKKAKEKGYTKILVYVDSANTPSLKGCHRAGFVPFQTRYEAWFLFKRRIYFRSISYN